ncbi:MAG: M23 family metallopeptidase [Chloroflexi bacterium]|nr:M23 family metallopeptidase [Chloroflexota bacterium]
MIIFASQGEIWWQSAQPKPVHAFECVFNEDGQPCDPVDPFAPEPTPSPYPHGYTYLTNPAAGKLILGTADDPLAMFSRRPLNDFIIPEGGLFMDPLHGGPHYGVDYANPDDYLEGNASYFYPVAPGYVTAVSTCIWCFVDGDSQGRVEWNWPQYNWGWGSLIIVETPYSPDISLYAMYAHINRDFVSLGDYVTPDQPIGAVGSTGYSQEIHLHLEIRYGTPGRFWNADFTQKSMEDHWLATMMVSPALAVLPENHPLLIARLDEWAALQHNPAQIP